MIKKKIAVLCISLLCILNCVSVYANENISQIEEEYNREVLKKAIVHEDYVEEELERIENQYDLSFNMPNQAIEQLNSFAKVTKDIKNLDDTYVQISYNITSENPVEEKVFASGNTEETYSVTNYTYVVKASTINSGSTTEIANESDVTIKNTVRYSYYDNNTVRMFRLDSGTTNITKFTESGLRNLVLSAFCEGFSNNGMSKERNSRTIPSPIVGENYTLNTKFNYFYPTSAAHILYGADVTYSHGQSSYTVSPRMSFGSSN